MIVINRVYCGYCTLTNQCNDPPGYLPKRDRGVTMPVYDCGQSSKWDVQLRSEDFVIHILQDCVGYLNLPHTASLTRN